MSDWIVGVRHPASRLRTRWRDRAVKICPSAAPVSHLVPIHPLPLSHPSLPAAHSADKVLQSLHLDKKNTNQLKSAPQNQRRRISAIVTFGDVKAGSTLNPLTAAVVGAVWAEGRSVASRAGGLLCLWPLVLASLIIDTRIHHHSSETDWGEPIPAESRIYFPSLFSFNLVKLVYHPSRYCVCCG